VLYELSTQTVFVIYELDSSPIVGTTSESVLKHVTVWTETSIPAPWQCRELPMVDVVLMLRVRRKMG
jgi:hypothetical protein